MAKKDMTLEEKLEEAIVKDGPYEVPGNWVWTKIKFIGNIKGGKRLPKGKQLLDFKTNYPYIRVADFDSGTIDIEGLKYLDEESFSEIKNYTISSKDVYVSIAGSIGKVGVIPENLDGANLTENAAKITDIKVISNRYLYYLLSSEKFQRDMKEASIATTQAKLALHKVADLIIPIPPLKEQQKIVDRIESLFEKLDKAKELIEEAREGFENRKAAILEKAFRGELTEKWREKNNTIYKDNLICVLKEKNKKYKKYEFNELFKDIKLPLSWRFTKLDSISSKITDGSHNPPKKEEQGYPMISAKNISKGIFDLSKVDRYVLEDDFIKEDKRTRIQCGDILLAIIGASIGNIAIYDIEDKVVAQRSICIIDTYIDNRFIYYMLKGGYLQNEMISKATGTAQPGLYLNSIRELIVPLPPLEEQKEIVRIIDKLMEEESIIEELTQLEEQIDLIKKSILAKAFRGELGTNCEEDESALELLKEVLSKS